MITIIQTVDIVTDILIILFLMKLLVDPREFFFNSALRPIDAITDPILERLHKYFRPTRFGLDYTPLIGILFLIVLHVLFHWLFTPADFFNAILISFLKLLHFLIMFFTFSIFVLAMVPVYSRNPISSFLRKLITPFEKPFRSITNATDKKPSLGTALIAGFIIGIVINIALESLKTSRPVVNLADWKNWIFSILTILTVAVRIYRFIILLLFAAVLLSWMSIELKNPFVNLVFILTEPILLPVRRLLPPAGGFDLTPWVASLIIGVVGHFAIRLFDSLRLWLG
ncbi:YggT family protein [bacterium]|nr:YggT family protein [candidate division CSSED10-310 bacterium]